MIKRKKGSFRKIFILGIILIIETSILVISTNDSTLSTKNITNKNSLSIFESLYANYNNSLNLIVINNNSAFDFYSTSGNGTKNFPYIISNYLIENTNGTGIKIINTDRYFILKNIIVQNSQDGILFTNVTNGIVKDSVILNNTKNGLTIDNCFLNTFTNNTITKSGLAGFSLTGSTKLTISLNTVINNYNGFELNASNTNDFFNNLINNNTFYGFNLINSSNSKILSNSLKNNSIGIDIDANCTNNTFEGNSISENRVIGVLSTATSNNIYSNEFNNNSGVYFLLGGSNNIINNTFVDSPIGIYIFSAPNNTIINNSFTNSGIFIGYTGNGQLELQGLVQNNTVNNKPLIFMQNVQNKTIPNDVGQVILINSSMINIENHSFYNTAIAIGLYSCKNIRVVNNRLYNTIYSVAIISSTRSTIENNSITSIFGLDIQYSDYNNVTNNSITSSQNLNSTFNGMYILYSSYNLIANNSISFFAEGIALYNAHSNTIKFNYIFNNTSDGIYVSGSMENIITYNMVKLNNKYGLYLDRFTNNNEIYLNEIIENSESPQAYDVGKSNSWTNGAYGNYWSDYNGPDSNGDGIGDSGYIIGGGNSVDTSPIYNKSSYQIIIFNLLNPNESNSSSTTIITTTTSISESTRTVSPTGLDTTTNVETTPKNNKIQVLDFLQSTLGLAIVGGTLSILVIVTGITMAEYRNYVRQKKGKKSSKTFREHIEGKFRSEKKQNYDTEEFKENLDRLEEIINENK